MAPAHRKLAIWLGNRSELQVHTLRWASSFLLLAIPFRSSGTARESDQLFSRINLTDLVG